MIQHQEDKNDDIKKQIEDVIISGLQVLQLRRLEKLAKVFPALFQAIREKTRFLDQKSPSMIERIYCILHDIEEMQLCKVCKSSFARFISFKAGYSRCCSLKCATRDPARSEKRRKTNIERYGTPCSLQSKQCIKKKQRTWIAHYGCDHPSKSAAIREKRRLTFIERYGVNSPGQIEEGKEKAKQTRLLKYGYEYVMQCPESRVRCQETMLKKYGVKWYLCKKELNRNGNTRKSYEGMLHNEYDVPAFTYEEYERRDDDQQQLKFRCKRCGNEFLARHHDGMHDRCPVCYPVVKCEGTSLEEKELVEFIKTVADDVKQNDRAILKPYELDALIVKQKLAIEFDGLYWHSYDGQLHDKNYHLKKTQMCEEKGIQLIHVFESEWIHKKDIVKSRLKNLLEVHDKVIYARRCQIREVDSKISREFQERTHIQGSVNAKLSLGLFFNSQLVALMTFGKSRFNKHHDWELLRFSTELNCHVVGAASKLLKHFEEVYKPKSIMTYADRRWSQGKLYKALGFQLDHVSPPSYWYFKNCSSILESRQKYQKHKLKELFLATYDENKTEMQNMTDNGYHCIFDCGNLVFVKNYCQKCMIES